MNRRHDTDILVTILTGRGKLFMSNRFVRIGEELVGSEPTIELHDAERLRDIGRSVFLSPKSTVGFDENTITGVRVVSNNFGLQNYHDPNINAATVIANDHSYEDSWMARVRYLNYRNVDGVLGFETDLMVKVSNEDVVLAKRSIYRVRQFTQLTSVKRTAIEVLEVTAQTVADTPLAVEHIDELETRVNRAMRRP